MKTTTVCAHLLGVKTKHLVLFGLAIMVALTTADAQNGSPSGSVPPQRKQNPVRVHTSPNPTAMPHETPTKNVTGREGTNDNHDNYAEMLRRYRHEPHDRAWWKQHYIVIVLVAGGYYYWDSGYWCPAWGYDPNYQTYDYDGPIYTYGNLLPDQVIINVQHALKELGYYAHDVTGSLSAATRSALRAFQQDYHLDITGAVDEPTVRALGLI